LPLNIIPFDKPEILSSGGVAVTFLPCFFMPVYVILKQIWFLVFSKKQILVAVIPGQKMPRTLLACLPVGRGKIVFGFFPKTIL